MTMAPPSTRDSLGDVAIRNVRALMALRGISQVQLAANLDISQTAVSKRLRGVTPFDLGDIERFAGVLRVRPMDLLDADLLGKALVATDGLPRRDSNLQPADQRRAQVIAAFRTRLGGRRPGYVDHQPAHDRILHSVDGTTATQVTALPTFDGASADTDREVA